MTRKLYNQALATGRPYFGSYMHSLQGNPIRHSYMDMMVADVASRRKGRPISILELGSWAGGSAITWASALKFHNNGLGQVYCIDPWRPYLDKTINQGAVYDEMDRAANSDGIFSLFCRNIAAAGFSDIVIPLRGTCAKILPVLREKVFDIVFIDGDHHYDRVRQDIELAQKLVRVGGIICGDDLELQLFQCDRQAAEQLAKLGVDFVADRKTGKEFHPGVTLAVDELLGEVSCWEGLWGMVRGPKGCEPLVLVQQGGPIPEHLRVAAEQAVVADDTLTLIGDMGGYNIVRGPDGFIAVSQAIGEIRLLYETLGERPLPPMILLAKDIGELHQQVEAVTNARCAHCEEAESLTRAAVSTLRWRELEVEGLAKYTERLEAALAAREAEAAKETVLLQRLDARDRDVVAGLEAKIEQLGQDRTSERAEAALLVDLAHRNARISALEAEVAARDATIAAYQKMSRWDRFVARVLGQRP